MEEMPLLNDAFGQILRAHREKAGLTQKKLAERMDASLSAIKKLEHGDRVPSLRTVLCVCRGLDMEPCDFVADVVNKLAYLENLQEKGRVSAQSLNMNALTGCGAICRRACD